MADFSWIAQIEDLSPAELTVRAQRLPPDNTGELRYQTFFPRRDVDSTKIQDALNLNFRPVASRREWNGKGRLIPLKTPKFRAMEFTPVEDYLKIEEYEMQTLMSETRGNQATVMDIIRARIPDRTDTLVEAIYRRVELDCVQAWTAGTVTQHDPQTKRAYTASYGIESGRIQTAATAWDDAGTNAYNEFIAWLKDARASIGNLLGVVTRQMVISAILTDTPTNAITGFGMTMAELEERVRQEIGGTFSFGVWEDTFDDFTDGGTATSAVDVFPAGVMAAVPADGRIGNTAFAPVYRAQMLSDQVPDAPIDERGVTIFHESGNVGKDFTVEAQLNAFPVPDSESVFVMNTLVT